MLQEELSRVRPQRGATPPERQFTKEELDRLRGGGFKLRRSALTASDPVGQTVATYGALIADTVGVAEAAKLLHVNASRIRQQLGNRSLYGIKTGGTWRLPRYQGDPARAAALAQDL